MLPREPCAGALWESVLAARSLSARSLIWALSAASVTSRTRMASSFSMEPPAATHSMHDTARAFPRAFGRMYTALTIIDPGEFSNKNIRAMGTEIGTGDGSQALDELSCTLERVSVSREKCDLDFVKSIEGGTSVLTVLEVEKRLSKTKYLARDLTGRCVLDLKRTPRDAIRVLCRTLLRTKGRERRGALLAGAVLLVTCHLKSPGDASKNGSFGMETLLPVLCARSIDLFNYKKALYMAL